MKRLQSLCACVASLTLVFSGVAPLVAADTTYTAYEQSLLDKGFPESYLPGLTALHNAYPHWVFEPTPTKHDWSTVLAAQNEPKRSLAAASWSDTYKSMEKGDYNWETGTYIGKDGSWVTASSKAVAYYLDPRNALTDPSVFQFLYLGYDNSQTLAGVQSILKGTFMSGNFTCADTGETYSYAQTILDAAKQSGAGAYYLAARIRQEVGVNGSALSAGTVAGYAGYYNFFNIGATQSGGNSALTNGAIYAKNQGWTNPRKAILGGAKFVAEGYIAEDQDTLYLQRFNVIRGVYWHQYMSNIAAPTSEASSMKKAYSDQLDTALVFHIPVYKDMPATASPKPSATGDNNNFLDSLSMDGKAVAGFDRYTGSYRVTVDNGVSSVAVTAKTNSSAARVAGTGTISLREGDNTVAVKVTASGGDVRTYTLTIHREASDRNTYLHDLSVNGQTVPNFVPNTETYRMTVGHVVDTAVIEAVTEGKNAQVSGTGTVPLTVGDNVVTLTVTAESGDTRTYTLTIHREASGNHALSSLSVDGTAVPGFDPEKTSYRVVVDHAVDSAVVAAVAADNTAQVSGTGTIPLTVGDNAVTLTVTAQNGDTRTYTLTICRKAGDMPDDFRYGDVNGDGKVTVSDVRLVLRAAVGKTELEGDPWIAADVNGDAKISVTDVRLILRFAVGKIDSFPVQDVLATA